MQDELKISKDLKHVEGKLPATIHRREEQILVIQTQYLCILVPAPFWNLICINFLQWCRLCTFWCYLRQIFIKFCANLASKLKEIMQKKAPCNGAIWDEFSEQYQ